MKNKLSILVVDDEKRVVDEITEFLKGRKYNAYFATQPVKGLEILSKNEIDIVILDIKMPQMSGLEMLKKIKELKPQTEIIMISGHGDMSTVIEAMRLGASDYFQKPFRLIDINNAITRTKRFIALNDELKETKENLDYLSEKLLENHFLHNNIISACNIKNSFRWNKPQRARFCQIISSPATRIELSLECHHRT